MSLLEEKYNHPLVSIIIPCYNHGEFINDSLKSIFESTYKNIEIIIVNDGSTDNQTNNILSQLNNSLIKVIHQSNGGQSVARNNAIRNSSGKYILPLDADNKIAPDFIELAINRMEEDSSIDVFYTDAIYFGEKNGINTNLEINWLRLLIENYIDTCAILRRKAIESVGLYDENIQGIEDWDLWLKLLKIRANFYYFKEPKYYYRYRSASFIRKDPNFNKRMLIKLWEKHKDLLNPMYLDEFVFSRFSKSPVKFIVKYSVRKWLPSFYNYLIKINIFQRF